MQIMLAYGGGARLLVSWALWYLSFKIYVMFSRFETYTTTYTDAFHITWLLESLQKEFFHFLNAPQLQAVFKITKPHWTLSFSSRKHRRLWLIDEEKAIVKSGSFWCNKEKGVRYSYFQGMVSGINSQHGDSYVALCSQNRSLTSNLLVKYQSL